MKVFISWSKERSRMVAEALRDWLPDVIQAVEPFLSTHDIPKGARWGLELARELEGTSVGIICLTPENLEERWILFEAGALSKMVDQARICTYLHDLAPNQLLSPLADFQATKAEREDTFGMVASINSAMGSQRLSDEKLHKAFDRWWDVLEQQLKAIPQSKEPAKTPTQEEILQEIYRFIRSQSSSTSSSSDILANFERERRDLFRAMDLLCAELDDKMLTADDRTHLTGKRERVRRRLDMLDSLSKQGGSISRSVE